MYDKIYTLAVPMADTVHSILNGRIFKIKKSDGGYLQFIDAITGDPLINSAPIDVKTEGPDGFISIITQSCTLYHLRQLSYILPTTISLDEPVSNDEHKALTFEVLKKENDYKPINYGDGYDQITYTFTQDITEDDFRTFCKMNNLELKPQGDWWQDYNTIFGIGNVWTWRHVRVYTD